MPSSSAARADAILKALCAKPPFEFSAGWPKLLKTIERQSGKGSSGRPDCIRGGPCSQGGAFDDERLLLTFCLKSKD